ncbi:hypothetical protein BJX64DRAFT_302326 [Aspergillus heterothallicus]
MASPFVRDITTHPLTPDKPNPQPFNYFDETANPPQWRPASSSADITNPNTDQAHQHPPPENTNNTLHLITWNIDFQVPYPIERMTAALHHLHHLCKTQNTSSPSSRTIILLQEMTPSTLAVIHASPWIRSRFYVTDLTPSHWRGSGYGTTTLVDRRLGIERVFRVPYAQSWMERDALFVDLAMTLASSGDDDGGGEGGCLRVVRVCNTHLESLASGTAKRPVQMEVASGFMHASDTMGLGLGLGLGQPKNQPHAAVLAGDLNAFAPEDLDIPVSCGLRDAFLVLGGVEETEEAFTWGKQNAGWLVGRFPDARMDKVLFCGGVEVRHLKRIGVGLRARVGGDEHGLGGSGVDEDLDEEEEEGVWVTDHYGLEAEFAFTTAMPESV